MSFKGFAKYPKVVDLSSWFHQSSSTWTQIGNSYNLYAPYAGGTQNIIGRYQTPPSTPYTVIAHVNVNPTDTTGLTIAGGLGFGDGTKSQFITLRSHANNITSGLTVLYCANSTTASSNKFNIQFDYGFPYIVNGWMAIRNDGTNIYYFVGDESGQNFYQIFSEAKGTDLGTINQIGIYTDVEGASTDQVVDSWMVLNV